MRTLIAILCLVSVVSAEEANAPTSHICSLRSPVGLLPAIQKCSSVPGGAIISGILGDSALAADGLWQDSLTIVETLAGEEIAERNLLLVERAISPVGGDLTPGTPGLWFLVPGSSSDRPVAIELVSLASEEESGTLEMTLGLLTAADAPARVAVLIEALSGGAETRHRASLDLESDQRHLSALDDRALARLAAELIAADRDDPALGALLRLYACSPAEDRVSVCLSTLTGPAGERTLPELRGLLQVEEFGLTAADLDPWLASDRPIEVQRRAMHLLARLPGESAASRLASAVDSDDLDLGSEALVGLAGRCPPELIERCRAVILLGIDTGPRGSTEIDRVLESRDLHRLRTSPYTGERFRQMASGFVLARGDQSTSEWLAAHVDRLADRNVGRFLAAMLASTWLDFEDPW